MTGNEIYVINFYATRYLKPLLLILIISEHFADIDMAVGKVTSGF